MANLHRAFAPHVPGKVAFKQFDKTATLDATIVLTSTTVAKNLEHVTLDEQIVLTLASATDVFPTKAVLDETIVLTSATAVDVIKTGNLDQPIIVTLAGQSEYGSNATVDVTIPLTLAGIGKIPLNGVVQRSLLNLFVLAGVGKVLPLIATLDVSLPALILAGQGKLNDGKLDEQIVLTSITATTQISSLHAAATMPALTGNAEISSIDSSVILPAFISNAVVAGENDYIGIGVLPAFIVSATTGHSSDTTLPALIGAAQIDNGNIITSSTSLPALTIDAVLVPDLSASSITTLPAITGLATVVSISDATSVVLLPALTGDAIALAGIEYIGIATLPLFTSVAVMQSGQFIVSVVTLPALTTNAIADNGGSLVTTTHVFNTENMAATEYSNYDFLAMAMFNGVPVGISTAGVFELSGSDDDGVDIAVDVLSGFSDLGTEDLKRMPNVYLGYKSDGDIQVQISIDGEPAIRTYTVSKISNTAGIKRGRAKPGKGLKSKYWQVGVKNVLGSDLELNDLGLYIEQFNRKVQ